MNASQYGSQYGGQYGAQPAAVQPWAAALPAPVQSGLRVHPTFIFLQWMLFFVKPIVTIGNFRQPIPWNRPTVVPLPPGQYQVKIHYPWLREGNPAIMTVTVHPGYLTEMKYGTRLFVFAKGDLKTPGFRPWGT